MVGVGGQLEQCSIRSAECAAYVGTPSFHTHHILKLGCDPKSSVVLISTPAPRHQRLVWRWIADSPVDVLQAIFTDEVLRESKYFLFLLQKSHSFISGVIGKRNSLNLPD
jgi:hypothetical protein